jgi:hypothetical protein
MKNYEWIIFENMWLHRVSKDVPESTIEAKPLSGFSAMHMAL